MVNIAEITTNLTQDSSGIWIARDQRLVSYPSDGNQACISIEENSFWFNHRNEVIASFVERCSPRQAFFDIGGGNGYVAMRLQRSGADTVLVEPGPQGARNALQRGVKVVVQSTLEDAGFKSCSMHSCGLFDVLEHIEDDVDHLKKIYSYLRPGGWLYITVPAFALLWSVDDVHAEHYRRYTAKGLAEKLTATGFAIRYCGYFFGLLAPAIFLLRTIPGVVGIRRAVSLAGIQHEHSLPGGVAGSLLSSSLNLELKRIEKWKRIPVGSSCIAVATKAR